MPARVLIAYDGSDDAREAIRTAGELFAGSQARVVHVWQSLATLMLHTDINSLTGPIQEAAREVEAADREQAARTTAEGVDLARDAGLDADGSSVEGHPMAWPALLNAADDQQADVLVVGSRGLSGVKSMLLGSVSSGILSHSGRPVLVVPPPGRRSSSQGGGPVLVGYDGSDHAKRAIEASARLFAGRSAQVATIWTSFLAMGRAASLGAPAAVAGSALEKLDEEAAARARAKSSEGAELAQAAGLDGEPVEARAHGNVWATLARLADDLGASALVVGSHGRSALGDALLGSVARGLAHHSSVPLVVVPPARR